MKRMSDYSLNKKSQIYYAHQWAEAGAYRCIDTCRPYKNVVVMDKDGSLPDPTRGRIARFRRLSGHEAEIHIKRHNNLRAITERKAPSVRRSRLKQLVNEDVDAMEDWSGLVS